MPQRVEGGIELEAPVETVYGYWETLENLPDFMANVEEVVLTGPDTTHWKVKGPFGRTLEFDAKATEKEPNRKIGWIATDGDIGNSGQVLFRDAGTNRTQVEVTLEYSNPPGGKAGALASRAVSDPQRMLEQNLGDLKDILEGRATPEEVRQRPAAATARSDAVEFLVGVGLLIAGVGVLALFLLRRRRSGPSRRRRVVFRL